MTLLFENLQKVVPLNRIRLKSQINILRKLFGVESYDLSVTCLTSQEIAKINAQYRGKKEPTDVLAFPFYENLVPGRLPTSQEHGVLDLGDIYLGIPYIYHQCKSNNQNLQEVLPVMVTHGICHLIGYDHETEKQYKEMYSKESLILTEFNKTTGFNCAPLLQVGHYLKE
ncbi:endoribonuclease YbeY-like [Crassostrea angulata]|uniref:endoribonuclease YbeY-like n=1 Tax=Magallana angulata TaxID=2784310 RepID=UPI0022B0C0F7|nr:endoribonuclease YbeY-like [Crassostrea angulata]